ncbi:MAG: sulfotransferase family protein [Chloroflexota bacterium]
MKIFGIGMMKTGTSTLGFCLPQLGYRHAPYTPKLLRQIMVGNYDNLAPYIDQYDSFDDNPWPCLYPWLDAIYPDSKFILTMRKDSEAWYNSICKHAKRRGPTIERRLVYGYAMPQRHKESHITQYEAHNTAVQAYFANRPNKLLVACWETGTGWAELCGFLGHDPPSTPLPHANASQGRSINWKRWARNSAKYAILRARPGA